jgi:hypothetical protein
LTEEVKSLWESSRGMKMFVEAIDSWMSIEACNWNREGSSTVTEKTKSLKLPERLRNLSITYSDVERVENNQRS